MVLFPACRANEIDVRFLRSENHTFSAGEQRLIRQIAESSTREVRRLLPALPSPLELTVRPGADVRPETGSSATAMPPLAVMLTIDARREEGVESIVRRWLRPVLFHELHHLTRWQRVPATSLVDHAVSEGLAAVFERDFAQSETPWAAYGSEVSAWADELLRLPDDSSTQDWIYRHPDGRRWIGMKTGAYWVDQASAKSGRSSIDLITLPAADIIALATK